MGKVRIPHRGPTKWIGRHDDPDKRAARRRLFCVTGRPLFGAPLAPDNSARRPIFLRHALPPEPIHVPKVAQLLRGSRCELNGRRRQGVGSRWERGKSSRVTLSEDRIRYQGSARIEFWAAHRSNPRVHPSHTNGSTDRSEVWPLESDLTLRFGSVFSTCQATKTAPGSRSSDFVKVPARVIRGSELTL